jgi:hypothetical protein
MVQIRWFGLASQDPWSLGLGGHGSDNQVVALFQLSFENGADFRVRMVGDSKRNLYRFHPLIGMEFPNNGRLGFRRASQILGTDASRALLSSGFG